MELEVTAARLSPNKKLIAASTERGVVKLYTRDLILHGGLLGHFDAINDISWSRDSVMLASAGADKLVILWDTRHYRPLVTCRGHTHQVTAVKFNPQGTLMASASIDETVRVWHAPSGECLHVLQGHTEVISSIDFSHDGTLIASGGCDGLVRLWDTSSGKCLETLDAKHKIVLSVMFTPNSKYIVVSTADGFTRVWDYVSIRCAKEIQGVADNLPRSPCFVDYKLLLPSSRGLLALDIQNEKVLNTVSNLVVYTVEHHDNKLLMGGPKGVCWLELDRGIGSSAPQFIKG